MIATVIPAYNEPAERLNRTVESALAVSDLVVIADDGSRVPIEHDRALVVRQTNKGPSAAMNLGARAALDAGASVLCRIDVGDVFRVDAKRRQLASAGAASWSLHYDLVESTTFKPLRWWNRQIYWDGAFCICSIVISADTWHRVNGFDESLRYCDDWDFTMRVQRAVGWEMFNEVTCEVGAFEGGHTKTAETDPIKRQRKHADFTKVRRRGIELRKS